MGLDHQEHFKQKRNVRTFSRRIGAKAENVLHCNSTPAQRLKRAAVQSAHLYNKSGCVCVCVLYRRPPCWTYRAEIWHGGPYLPRGGYSIKFVPVPKPPGSAGPKN